jgi:cytochrome c oxidase assembly protein subunit 15
MDGDWIPPFLFDAVPWWRAFFEDITTIQFTHRMTGYLTAAAAVWLFIEGRRAGGAAKRAATGALHITLVQIAIGIATLLAVVPVWLGALHQATAVLVWAAALIAARLAWTGARSPAQAAIAFR